MNWGLVVSALLTPPNPTIRELMQTFFQGGLHVLQAKQASSTRSED